MILVLVVVVRSISNVMVKMHDESIQLFIKALPMQGFFFTETQLK
jgi:hypothetical protein